MGTIKNLSEFILKKFYDHTDDHVFTVAISGIDASGKGYVTRCLEDDLRSAGLRVADINLDLWQNPISMRLTKRNPAENFYRKAFRWNAIFKKLIIPLRKNRGVQLTCRLVHSHADEYFPNSSTEKSMLYYLREFSSSRSDSLSTMIPRCGLTVLLKPD